MDLSYPKRIYEKKDPIPYLPFDSTTATWVDTYEGVLEMLEELKKAKEIAVDLEHHDYRSYPGLTSLMQISTREKDWIVDTLRPWRHKLEVLNEVFADPNIIKVRSCIFLLQRPGLDSLTNLGLARRLHGYRLATAGSWSVHGWHVRHSLRMRRP
jgi:hypothetical protein